MKLRRLSVFPRLRRPSYVATQLEEINPWITQPCHQIVLVGETDFKEHNSCMRKMSKGLFIFKKDLQAS